LIFDEVITGLSPGPRRSRGVLLGEAGPLVFRQSHRRGLPVGAFGGSKEILSSLAPLGPVYQAGTLSGNPLATAAGVAVLDHVTADDLAILAERVTNFARELEAALRDAGLFARTPNVGALMGLYLAREEFVAPTNFAQAKSLCDNGIYPAFFHAMLRRGVALAPGAYEILFVSLAHTTDDLARTVDIAADAAREVAAEVVG
jgi:glutamate-1-semialdehyde 2,1-aminomutase